MSLYQLAVSQRVLLTRAGNYNCNLGLFLYHMQHFTPNWAQNIHLQASHFNFISIVAIIIPALSTHILLPNVLFQSCCFSVLHIVEDSGHLLPVVVVVDSHHGLLAVLDRRCLLLKIFFLRGGSE